MGSFVPVVVQGEFLSAGLASGDAIRIHLIVHSSEAAAPQLTEQDRQNLMKEGERVRLAIEKLESQINSPAYSTKVPPSIQEKNRERLSELQSRLSQIENHLQ